MRSSIGANARIFFEGAMLSYRALFSWISPSKYLASKVIGPLAQLAFFTLIGTFGGSADATFFVLGNAIHAAAVSGIYGVTMSIAGDRWYGTLAYLFGAPSNRMVLFFGRSAIHIADGVLGVVLSFGWGMLLFGLRLSGPEMARMVVPILAAVVATCGMGLLMGCIGLITRNVMFVNNTVFFVLLAVSGANVQLELLPGWIQAISAWIPLTHAIAAARLVETGATLSGPVGLLVLRELAIGAIYLSAGYLLFHRFERRAKAKGSLETM